MNNTPMEAIENIISIIREKKGIDFSQYKINTIFRRIRQRALVLNLNSIEEYYLFLSKNLDNELEILVNYFLINTTEFFRDPLYFYYFEYLVKKMINNGTKFIKTISIGCSSGEEPYSIGIILNEQKKKYPDFDFYIDAIDIDVNAIKEAKKAIYMEHSINNVPYCIFCKYFTKSRDKFKLNTFYFKNKINFLHGNVLEKDIKVEGIFLYNFIFIRNVLIYLQPNEISKLLDKILNIISLEGFLILGSSEIIPNGYKKYFNQLCKGVKIYKINR